MITLRRWTGIVGLLMASSLYWCQAQPVAAQEAGDACQLKVMTFNIRYNNPGDGADAWPHRKDMVANVIREHADIVGLQEAQLDQIQDLEQRLAGFKWYGVGRDDGKDGGEFCPIFYRAERFDVLKKQTFWLSETPQVPGSKGWDTAITRLMTMVQFRHRSSGTSFWMINTHFDHRGPVARENSGRIIREHFNRLGKELPIVVTGDFNALPTSKPYQVMTGEGDGQALLDSRTICQQAPQGPDSTWCGFQQVIPGRRIDFIFVWPGMDVLSHRTLDDRVDERFPSDHLPVVVQLRLANSQ